MKILGIDTSSNILSICVSENDNILGENTINNMTNHSPKIVPMIDELLINLKIDVSEIDVYACSIGPGSFTGIRIGLGLAKSMAQASKKDIIGVNSLLSLAKNINTNSYICPMIDAKNENIYTCILNENYEIVLDYTCLNIHDLIEKCCQINKPIYFIGNGAIIYKDLIYSQLSKDKILDIIDSQLNAKNICMIGYEKYINGEIDNILSLSPTYLRPTSAERLCNNG